jgi:glyoxylase-like metal-dependent hydrolase (beta-lactamase superfamily II)
MKEPHGLKRDEGVPEIMEEENASTRQPPALLPGENQQFALRGGRRSPHRRSSLLLPGRSLDDDALAWFRLQVNAGAAGGSGSGADGVGGGRSRRRRSSQSIDVPDQVVTARSSGAAGGDNYQEDNNEDEDDDDDDNNNITHSDHEGQAESSTARRRSSLRLASLMLDGGGGSTANANSANRKGAPRRRKQSRIYDDPAVTEGYNQVPLLETIRLPRGGTSISTSVGRIQFGIPPETIKDSMRLGLEVPRVFIVPVERFCREVGPALGINLAECEFPAYFNWFVKRKRCTLVVDSAESERDIRNVFEETLLGPKEFRDVSQPKAYDEEDFDPSFPPSSRPNFFREFQYFRRNEGTETSDELTVDVLIDFLHFSRNDLASPPSRPSSADDHGRNESIGVPPMVAVSDDDDDEEEHIGWHASTTVLDFDMPGQPWAAGLKSMGQTRVSRLMRSVTEPSRSIKRTPSSRMETDESELAETDEACESVSIGVVDDDEAEARPWIFSQVKWLGEVATVWPADATPEQVQTRAVPRVEIFKMPGASEYVVHDVDVNNYIVGKARLGGAVEVPDEMAVEGFLDSNEASEANHPQEGLSLTRTNASLTLPRRALPFYPPSFGVTSLGNSHGFDKNGSTSGYVIWINGRGVMVDPPPYSSATLEREGIRPQTIIAIIITHCHADHDAGAFQKVLTGSRVAIITTPSIYKSFIRKYSALSGLSPGLLRRSHRFRAAVIGRPLHFQGATFHFWYTLHTIPCIALKVEWRGKSVVFTGDHLNLPPLLDELEVSVRKALRSLTLPVFCEVDFTLILFIFRVCFRRGEQTTFGSCRFWIVMSCCTRQERPRSILR